MLAWAMGRLLAHLKRRGAKVQLPQVEERDLATLSGTFLLALKSGSTAVTNHASGFLALLLDEAQPLFAELKGCLAGLWEELGKDVATATGRSAGELWDLAAPAIGRTCCPLQVVWALKAVPSDISDRRGLHEVEALYAAVKRSRPVGEHLDGGPVRKCGQCGRREAMGGPDGRDGKGHFGYCDSAQLLLEVRGEGAMRTAFAVEKANARVQAGGDQGTRQVVMQQGVAEGQQGVDRVRGRVPFAAMEGPSLGEAGCQGREVEGRAAPLEAEQAFQAVGVGRALLEVAQACRQIVVALPAEPRGECRLIVQLGGHHVAGEAQAGGLVLGVAGLRHPERPVGRAMRREHRAQLAGAVAEEGRDARLGE